MAIKVGLPIQEVDNLPPTSRRQLQTNVFETMFEGHSLLTLQYVLLLPDYLYLLSRYTPNKCILAKMAMDELQLRGKLSVSLLHFIFL